MTINQEESAEYKILYTACEQFALHGYSGISNRELAAKAGVNSALINYYFRSKEQLYERAMEYCYQILREKYPIPLEGDIDPLEGVRNIVVSHLSPIMDEGPEGWFPRMALHEMSSKISNMRKFIRTYHRPIHERLKYFVAQYLEEAESSLAVRAAIFSIVSQWVMMNKTRAHNRALFENGPLTPEEIEIVIVRIWKFILGGLQALKNESFTKI